MTESKPSAFFSRRRALLGACLTLGAGGFYSLQAAPSSGGSRMDSPAPALRRGVNLSDWFQYSTKSKVSAAQLNGLKAAGFDHVRLPIDPVQLGWQPDSAIDQPLFTKLDALDEALRTIHAAGLIVILDLHPGREANTYLKKDQAHTDQVVMRAWEQLSQRYRKIDARLLCFELMNEPGRFYPADEWNAFQAKLIATVRKQTSTHWLIVNSVWHPVSTLRTAGRYNDDKLIYGFHYYKPFVVTHQGANWEPSAAKLLPYLSNIPYPSDLLDLDSVKLKPGADRDYILGKLSTYKNEAWNLDRIRRDMAFHADWARSNKVPILCNEIGIMRTAVDAESRKRWLADATQALNENDIPWTLWDYCNDFGIAQCGPDATVIEPELVTALHLDRQDKAK